MVIHDINQNKREVILLIHPMNFSGKMMMDSMAKELGCAYRYIVPDLSGHGEEKDDPYVSIAEEAATLAHYLKEHVFLSKQKKARQDTIFSYGDKDLNVGHARRSIKKHYSKAKLKIWQGYGHGEEMIQNTETYMAFVKGCMD